jgi:diaminopimelate epimerase
MSGQPFIKMQGLGNDFVVLDARAAPIDLEPGWLRAVADRRTGVGCDQIIVIDAPDNGDSDARIKVRNADGSFAEACGNGTRCIAQLLMNETGRDRVAIVSDGGHHDCTTAGGGLITADMGVARDGWGDIPLDRDMDTLAVDLGEPELGAAVAVNVGNPHAVFFVPDAAVVDLEWFGPRIEHSARFPQRTNVEVATITGTDEIRLRVWERGVGITRACGTGACATAVAAARRGLAGRTSTVTLDGGMLRIEWRHDDHVLMTGPAAESFRGILPPNLIPKNGGLVS